MSRPPFQINSSSSLLKNLEASRKKIAWGAVRSLSIALGKTCYFANKRHINIFNALSIQKKATTEDSTPVPMNSNLCGNSIGLPGQTTCCEQAHLPQPVQHSLKSMPFSSHDVPVLHPVPLWPVGGDLAHRHRLGGQGRKRERELSIYK